MTIEIRSALQQHPPHARQNNIPLFAVPSCPARDSSEIGEPLLRGLIQSSSFGYIQLMAKANIKRNKNKATQLEDLVSVGPAIRGDFERLGIHSVAQLRRANPKRLYDRLCRVTGTRQDPCVLDVFTAAVAQAKNPRLPAEQCQWWYWSRKRKESAT
jgi:pathogenicity locus Cdd1 protein